MVGTLGMALAAIGITRARTMELALASFASARAQLSRSLALRHQAFEAASNLSFIMDVMRQVTAHRDKADFGFGSPEEDARALAELHRNLVDSDWNWARVADEGFFGITDYKGRVLYTEASLDAFGASALELPAVKAAYDHNDRYLGAMVVRGDDPALVKTKLIGAADPSLYVLYARGTVFNGEPRAVFVQGVRAQKLLEDVALADPGTLLALVGPDGAHQGTMPPAVLEAGLHSAAHAGPREVEAQGQTWLVQSDELPGLGGHGPIGRIVLARNLDVGFAALRGATVWFWGASLLLLFAAAGLAVLLSGRISKPIVALEGAARAVRDGNLDAQVTVRTNDELGRLADAFNEMTEGLRDRDRIKRTFKKYLSSEVVDFLLAHPEAQNLGGERRRLTVMFSDLANFTALSERLAPEKVVGLLNGYFTRCSRHIAQRGGTIDKYLGDAVMAFFGAPIPRVDHATRACLAALDQLAVIDALRTEWADQGVVLDARIGLNTGEMLVGNIGGDEGQDYTVIGDAVNLASRLEGVNKVYGTRILISDGVYEEAKAEVEVREIDLIRVKGKLVPVRIYELLGPKGFFAAHPEEEEVARRYGDGLVLYRARRFAAAAEAFEAALGVDPKDGPAKALLERARQFESTPPPEEWDGVFELHSK